MAEEDATLDIALTKNILATAETIEELTSDHFPVVFHIHNKMKVNPPRMINKYKKVDWKEFRNIINRELKMDRNINNWEDIE